MSQGIVGSYSNLPVVYAQRAEDPAAAEPTEAQQQVATEFPPGLVSVERTGTQMGLRIPGGIAAVGGAVLLGMSLLSRKAPGAAESRLLAAPLAIGGSLVGLGAASVIGAELLPPKQVIAVATNLPTRAKAQQVANTMSDRQTKVVEDVHGKFAVIDEGPIRSGGSVEYGYERGRGHYYGDGHYHGQHYYGDGHYHDPGYYEPWYPGSGDYYPEPYYPTPSGGHTSPGDDYDYSPSYPSSGGSTSSGDDGGGYTYNPPSYDPPSGGYSGGSSSGDSGGYSGGYSGGNSSSNGNPSYDDF